MSSHLKRIEPFQAAKVSAVLYFILGAVVAVPLLLINMMTGSFGRSELFGVGFIIFLPILYALMGFIVVPIFCWLYNLVAKWTGGFEITIQETSEI